MDADEGLVELFMLALKCKANSSTLDGSVFDDGYI